MNDKRFSRPVEVLTPWGQTRPVHSAWEALECLEAPWFEERRGRHFRAAVRTCRDALDGLRPASAARKAFLHAAREVQTVGSSARRARI